MNNQENTKKQILVLGGTGKTGSRVVSKLQQLGWPVRIGSRNAAIPFDWNDQSTWAPVLQDIDSVYISYQPDLAVPGAADTIRSLTHLAVKSGVTHLVLLSGRGEEEAQACEKMVINAGVDWTILRASWFCQNFSEGYVLDPILAGQVDLPVGHVPEPFIDADDIADVAVAALTNNGHAGQVYELTGPRLLTFRDAIQEIAAALNQPIQYQQIPMDAYKAMLREYQIPDDYIWLISYLFTEVLDGRNASLADGVERALGRKPTDFSEYIRKAIATGAWQVIA
ncbi:NAD(P)H-binding protein [Mucilaginibacter sp. HC2]|uniref:SDR family oxidoreductase n=1 Tax=Mucilaginibacter inviolabilis TaxID=2714892 RepID=UPI00140B1C8F|nr:NAD(P)H-binding protein [Mucilaginibacter inviolabilis]NHA07668.1 NAD(P)H-binding protein [Mucilaginibacter inviolabilis]